MLYLFSLETVPALACLSWSGWDWWLQQFSCCNFWSSCCWCCMCWWSCCSIDEATSSLQASCWIGVVSIQVVKTNFRLLKNEPQIICRPLSFFDVNLSFKVHNMYRNWLRPKLTMVYHVSAPQIWEPKSIKVIKKIVKQTQIVPSSSLMYVNNEYCNQKRKKNRSILSLFLNVSNLYNV